MAALALEDLPTELHFVRSHFGVPALDSDSWTLDIDGAVESPRRYALAGLRRRPARTQVVVLECAGHRRNEFEPSVAGLPWGVGAVSEARWTGISLGELLREASPAGRACEVVFEGADRGANQSADREVPFARSIPLERALAEDVLLAWEMNSRPIPPKHGAPLRLIVPGSYGVASIKWLRRITVLERPFTGPFQLDDYQVDGEPLQELKVNSLIVTPSEGRRLPSGPVRVSGVAWGGEGGIRAVEVRGSRGPWQQAVVNIPRQTSALHRWSTTLELPSGEHRIEARASDHSGAYQPEHAVWNTFGYANNSIHGIRISCVDTVA